MVDSSSWRGLPRNHSWQARNTWQDDCWSFLYFSFLFPFHHSFLGCFYVDGEIIRECFNALWCVSEGWNIYINQLNGFSGIYWKKTNLCILNGVMFAQEYNNDHHHWPWVEAFAFATLRAAENGLKVYVLALIFVFCQFQIYLKPPEILVDEMLRNTSETKKWLTTVQFIPH